MLCLLIGVLAGSFTAPAAAADPLTIPLLNPDKRLRVMFVGDSITQGRQGDATYRYFVWREFVRQQVPVTFVGPTTELAKTRGMPSNYLHTDLGFESRHAAKASSKFPSHIAQIDRLVRAHRPDVIALLLGYNDAGKTDGRTIAINTARYMELTWQADPDIRFVLGEITWAYRFDRSKAVRRYRETTEANALVRQYYGDDPRVSIASNVTGTRRPWDAARHSYDGVHPNMAGQSLLGFHFAKAFRAGGDLYASPAAPTSPQWRVRPRIESVGVASRRSQGRWTVVLRWPTQARRIYVKGFRLIIQRPNGTVVTTRKSTHAKRVWLPLPPGRYRAKLVAQRVAMVSPPGPTKRFRVR